jgi:hypothetical protein
MKPRTGEVLPNRLEQLPFGKILPAVSAILGHKPSSVVHGAWRVRCLPDRPNSLGAVALKKRSADLAAFIPSVWLMIQDPVPLAA